MLERTGNTTYPAFLFWGHLWRLAVLAYERTVFVDSDDAHEYSWVGGIVHPGNELEASEPD